MKLKRPLPPDRTYEQLLNHFLVEKALADKLRKSNRAERQLIFDSMYDELFSKVPDHPRLTRRDSEHKTAQSNASKFSLIHKFLDDTCVFLEFAPGDCEFVYKVAGHVKQAYGVDISDQRKSATKASLPDNFELILYDGYNLDQIENNSIDLLFSDQLIEHFHPEDTAVHFKIVHNILKPGGKYVFRTPHELSGPHDISMYFSDEAEGFHLKEWTYLEIGPLLNNIGYSKFHTRWRKARIDFRMPYFYFTFFENFLGLFPKRYIKKIAKYLLPSVYVVAFK